MLPARLGPLGLDSLNLERHIAYDIGAAVVVREILHPYHDTIRAAFGRLSHLGML